MTKITYCSVLARNYLPQALALADSVQRYMSGADLCIFLVDGSADDVPEGAPLRVLERHELGLTDRQYRDLATIYDVVEFSTAVKPLVFKRLLVDAEQVVYLDPDTWVVSPLDFLEHELDEASVLLTPHFLRPITPGESYISEVHSLTVGVYNLGFAGFSRSAVPFLEWWWSHLERECLIYPLLSIFVDQKWVDIGAQMFDATPLRHPGVNVGPWNFHERDIVRDESGDLCVNGTDERLALMHFSGFDPTKPEDLSVRLGFSLADVGLATAALDELAREYAAAVLAWRARLAGQDLSYRFASDLRGRSLSRRIRRAYRKALLEGRDDLPSPLVAGEEKQFAAWRRSAVASRARDLIADSALATKYVFPGELKWIRARVPTATDWIRETLLSNSNVRR